MTKSKNHHEQKVNARRCWAGGAVLTAGVAAAMLAPIAGTASALPTGGGSAIDTVNELKARGYHVQLNANTVAPLSECSVTDIHGLSGSNFDRNGHRINASQFDTVYVNVSCRPQG